MRKDILHCKFIVSFKDTSTGEMRRAQERIKRRVKFLGSVKRLYSGNSVEVRTVLHKTAVNKFLQELKYIGNVSYIKCQYFVEVPSYEIEGADLPYEFMGE